MGVYLLLLRLYPASFRHEYGDELRALFARRLRETTSVLAAGALWLGAIADVLGNADDGAARGVARLFRREFAAPPWLDGDSLLVADS